MTSDPSRLEHDEIVQEIQSVKTEMERLAARMVELSQVLYRGVRRAPSDDYTSRYIAFANAWTRFGSMVDGGLRRTSGVTRLVTSIHQERLDAEESTRIKEARDRVQVERKATKSSVATSTDLISLYGEEMVNHAGR